MEEHTLGITEAVKKFVTKIKKKYKERRLIHDEQLLYCRSEMLVRLELVEVERLQASEQRGSGNTDNTVIRTPLAYADLFKVESGKKEIKKILIDGDAGIGKTTFCIAVCEDWANGKILQEFELVLLLPLRQQEVASAGSLLDLLKLLHPSDKVCGLVKEYFEEDEGRILIIADGWDELCKENREEGSFIRKFLFSAKYSSISTIATSRPSASAPLHLHKCIDRYAEIRGFDKEHIVEYINSEFDPENTSQLIDKLESNPLIEDICSVPLNCAIVCHLWRELKGDLPTTMTGLYTQLILNIILRNIRKVFPVHENMFNLSSFDDLPESLQQSWWLLCKFAFQTLEKDQLVFSDKELIAFFPQGLALDDTILCFGLVQASVSSLEVGCSRSFHFLHLTFQEYLAVLFLIKEECDSRVACYYSLISKVASLFQRKQDYLVYSQSQPITDDSDVVGLRFFFGITFTFKTFRNRLGHRILAVFANKLNLYQYSLPYGKLALCHWAYEAHNQKFVQIVANQISGNFVDFIETSSILCSWINIVNAHPCARRDFPAVVYVIANTQEGTDVEINFRSCGLQDCHIIALKDALAKRDGKLQVKALDFERNNLTDQGVTELFHGASAAFQSLECLQLGGNRIEGEGINSVLATLSMIKSGKVKVTFDEYGLNPFKVSTLKIFSDSLCHHQLTNLKELHLIKSLSSDADANAEFILALGHCRGLSILNLSDNNLHIPGGRALGKVLPQLCLVELGLQGTRLSDEGLLALVQSLEAICHIGKLRLDNNNIHAAGVSYLADAISMKKIVIVNSLSLCYNPLKFEGVMPLVRLLSSEHFLAQFVDLSNCQLAEKDNMHNDFATKSDSMSCLSIKQWICNDNYKADNIDALDLSEMNFTGESTYILIGFIYLCPCLAYLYCRSCNISSDDLKRILMETSELTLNLKCWYLRGNNIDDNGVSALIEHLPMIPSLISYDINDKNISPSLLTDLSNICERRMMTSFGDIKEFVRQHFYESFQALWKEIVDYLYQLATELQVLCTTNFQLHLEVIELEEPDENKAVVPHKEADRPVIDDQLSTQDLVELITPDHTSSEPLLLHQAALEATNEIEDTNIGSSDSEDFHTPPSSPSSDMKAHENEHLYLHEKIAEKQTTLDREERAVAGGGIDQLHPIVDSERITMAGLSVQSRFSDILSVLKEITSPHQIGGPQAKDVDSALEELTDPFRLGLYLNIEEHELKIFEKNYPQDVKRQKVEVIEYWLRNNVDCSWEVLANAVEKMGGHGKLVQKLRDMPIEAIKSATK